MCANIKDNALGFQDVTVGRVFIPKNAIDSSFMQLKRKRQRVIMLDVLMLRFCVCNMFSELGNKNVCFVILDIYIGID